MKQLRRSDSYRSFSWDLISSNFSIWVSFPCQSCYKPCQSAIFSGPCISYSSTQRSEFTVLKSSFVLSPKTDDLDEINDAQVRICKMRIEQFHQIVTTFNSVNIEIVVKCATNHANFRASEFRFIYFAPSYRSLTIFHLWIVESQLRTDSVDKSFGLFIKPCLGVDFHQPIWRDYRSYVVPCKSEDRGKIAQW